MKGIISQLIIVCLMILLSSCNPSGTINPTHSPISIFTKTIAIDSVKASNGSATIAWTGSTDASYFTIKYGTTAGVYSTTASTNATSPFVITGLTNGSSYFILVTEVQKTGKTVDATSVGVTPIGPFTITSAAASNQQVSIIFPAVTGASAYTVKYGTVNGSYNSIASTAATSPYIVTGLTNGVTYYFMVTATNSNNGSQDASSALAAIPTGPTTYPTGLIASSTASTHIALSWNAATSAISYNVKRSVTSGGAYSTISSAITTTTFTDTTAVDGTRYFYIVTANSPGGESSISNEANSMSIASFTTLAVAITTSGQANLSWTAPTGATSYDVKYRITGAGNYSTFSNVTASSANVTGLATGTSYELLVTAKNSYSGTLDSNMVSATTLAQTSLSLGALSESVKVDWTNVFSATSYDLMYGTASGVYTTTLANQNQATGVTVAPLVYSAPGPKYYFKIRAHTAAGYVDSGEYSVDVKPPVPAAPVLTGVISNVVTLTWPVPGLGTIRYSVLRNGSALAACTSIVALTCIDTTAVAGTTYTYTMTATNDGGTSAVSNTITAQTIAAFNISNVTLDPATPNQAIVSWPTSLGAAAGAYTVKYTKVKGDYTTPANVTIVTTTATSPLTVAALPAQTVYFMVTATNAIGTGAAKNASADFAAIPVGAPTGLGVVPGVNSLAVNWTGVAGATSYDILYSSSVDPATTNIIYNVTSGYIITGLGYGSDQTPTQYTVTIRANNLSGGVLSAAVISTVNYPIFMRPVSPTITGGINQITINWGPSVGQGAITYTVQRSTSVNGPFTNLIGTSASCISVPSTTLTCVDDTATAGVTYFYVILATESLIAPPGTQTNTSAYSSVIVFAQSIAQPTISSVEIRGVASGLSVTFPTIAGGQSYTLSGGGAGVSDLTWPQAAGATANYTGLTAGTTYNFILTVSNTVTALITVNGVPTITSKTTTVFSAAASGIPLGTFTENAISAGTLTWNLSTGASNYDVVYDTVTHAASTPYPTSPYNATPLASNIAQPSAPATTVTASSINTSVGANFFYRVMARNSYGTIFSSNENSTSIASFTGISSIDNVTSSTMTIHWAPHPSASYYRIYRERLTAVAVPNALIYTTTVGVVSSSYTDTALTAGVQYRYYVNAVDGAAVVADTSLTNKVVQATIRPAAPTAITLQNPNLYISSVSTNTGLESKPTFQVSGVANTDVVKLYEDSACTVLAGSATSTGATVNITLTNALPNPGTTRPYTHTYYATTTPAINGWGANGAESACSIVTGTYNYYPCLTNYSPVPGNATLGTNPFCVMNYEARNISGIATSLETGIPWTGVTATQAKTYCNEINYPASTRNFDLISNLEWMTIARNAEAVAANWYGGVVNVNSMFSGNSAGLGTSCSYPDRLLPVVDVAHTTAAIITSDVYDQVCGNAAWNYQAKRTLTLANNYSIWDMAGNSGEIVEWTTNRSAVGTVAAFSNAPAFAGCPVGWEEYKVIGSMSACAQAINTSSAILPSSTTSSQVKRHGLLYGGTSGVAVRGGSYNNVDLYTGIYALDFSVTPSATTSNIGFRCVDRP